ncbi:MAG: hypothetical protein M3R35_00360 [Candidatus Eremiobacteraeota bacterium]|nr:hypothetical protein [Candidatus Eremiobacteraeota bacterium]
MSDISLKSSGVSRASRMQLVGGLLLFAALAVIGLFFVKWMPYWNKAHLAAHAHAIGASIVSGKSATPPAVGLPSAIAYGLAYFKAVWEALVLALILGATVQVFVPRRWLHRLIGAPNARSAAVAGALSLGGMM